MQKPEKRLSIKLLKNAAATPAILHEIERGCTTIDDFYTLVRVQLNVSSIVDVRSKMHNPRSRCFRANCLSCACAVRAFSRTFGKIARLAKQLFEYNKNACDTRRVALRFIYTLRNITWLRVKYLFICCWIYEILIGASTIIRYYVFPLLVNPSISSFGKPCTPVVRIGTLRTTRVL